MSITIQTNNFAGTTASSASPESLSASWLSAQKAESAASALGQDDTDTDTDADTDTDTDIDADPDTA
jgi:hypothetical protein